MTRAEAEKLFDEHMEGIKERWPNLWELGFSGIDNKAFRDLCIQHWLSQKDEDECRFDLQLLYKGRNDEDNDSS